MVNLEDLLVQVPPTPITLKEYVLLNWFKLSEDDGEDKEWLFGFKMIVINIDVELYQIQV